MAVVNMSKLSIVGLAMDKRQILDLLMKRGFVQIDDSSFLMEDEEIGSMLQKDGHETELMEIEQKIFHISQSLESIKNHVKVKKSFLAPKSEYQFLTVHEADDTFETSLKINVLYKDLEAVKNEKNSLATSRDMLLPWASLDVPLGKMETQYSKMILGTFPVGISVEAVREKLDEVAPESVLGAVGSDKQLVYVYLIAHKEVYDSVTEVLKDFGFVFINLHGIARTPADQIKEYEKQMAELEKEQGVLIEGIKANADKIPILENLYDFYVIKRDGRKTHEKLVKTKTTFCLTGWLPAKKADELTAELTEQFDCYVETEEGNKEEGFPVLLENNRIVTPFESITNMYSCPSTKDIDPNAIMAFFYIIFFGMMLSDAGYGIIIACVCGFIVHKKKLKKGEGNLYKLLGICGISTTVWGLIFGGIFGDMIPIRALISPLDDVMVLMGLSLLFGLLHIYVGLGVKGYKLIRDGKVLDALFDVGLWYIFITGICLLVVPVVAGPIGVYATIGKYLSIIGAVCLILTQGRSQKNIFMKGFKGVSSLYDITGYFADVLSYSRLMALCLSTGVIGQVINLLGSIAGPIPAIFIGIIGHTANLLINALGAYVHTSRLQYVEFFGKFYDGGGNPFSPFKYRTKYTSINTSKE